MAFDQNSIPKDLRPLNVVRNVAEEPRIASATSTGRSPDGYFPNPVREIGSPDSVPVFYPAAVSEPGFVGLGYGNAAHNVAAWCPRVAVPAVATVPPAPTVPTIPVAYQSVSPAVGFGYSPNLGNRAAGGTGELVSSSFTSTGSGGSPNLGNFVVGGGVDLASQDIAARIGYTPNLSNRVTGNAADQILNDPVVGFGYIPNIGNRVGGNAIDQASDEGGDDSVSGKKLKFLCSFGGKILPRPSDGVLRYVGGHTRIISVRRDVSFSELVQKMMDTYGQPVVIKYQLPDEDLDALVSVSCPDDLDNMMEEYEKLIERSSDGSAKLRVFLFSASELDPSGMVPLGDLHDGGQRYVDAVNGIVDGISGGGITRKESIASATSTHSDFSGSEAIDNSLPSQGEVTGPLSTSTLLHKQNSANSDETSPGLVYVDTSTAGYVEASAVPTRIPLVKSGPPWTSPSPLEIELERSVPVTVAPQHLGFQQPGLEIPTPAFVPAYVDPRQEVVNQVDYLQLPPQMGFPNPQLLGTAGPVYAQPQLHGNGGGVITRQFVPSVCTTVNPSPPHIGIRENVVQPVIQPQQARLDNFVNERTFVPRVVQLPVEQSYNSYQVPVSSAVVGGNYGRHQVPNQDHVIISDGLVSRQQVIFYDKIPRLKECYMCQKQLPHAHSDTLAQGQRDSGASSSSDSSSTHHSLRLDDHLRAQPTTRVMVTGGLGGSALDRGVEARRRVPPHVDPQIGNLQPETSGFLQNLEVKHERDRIIPQQIDTIEHSRIPVPQAVIGRATDIQPPNSAYMATVMQYGRDDPVQQPSVAAHYLVKQDALVKPVIRDMPPVGGVPVQGSERLIHESPKEYSNKFPGIVTNEDTIDTGTLYDQLRPIEGRMEAVRICPPEISVFKEHSKPPVDKLRIEDSFDYRTPHVAGREVLVDKADKFETTYSLPTEALPSSTTEILYIPTTYIPTSRLVESYEVAQPPMWGNPGYYAQPKVGAHPLDCTEVHYGNPAFPSIDAPPFPPSSRSGDVQDSSDSLFSNQDPWNLRHDTQFPPPRPSKSPSKLETYATKDPFGENCLGSNVEQNVVEDGVQPSLGILNKDLGLENSQLAKGSAEEQIRNDLQAVAEGVAASVFQPATPSNPESATNFIQDANVKKSSAENKAKVEVVKTKVPERANMGFPVSDGIGRLQIIKNGDLEELKELGSGTFGTVYHGKWRGTDVAIKRISDRCFAGKPSEQERMRDDFWNEAIKLADLHHPNVLAFYGVVLDGPGGSVATVTEYMVNGSLRNALQKNEKSLDKRKRLLIAMDVAFGMEYLHGKNIVHFDLKSDNLLVNLRDPHRPICKVGDLGLSKVKCHTLISGGVRGTLPWMAPELLNGSSSLVSEKVDVFSFGIVMWELLTGEEPYADLHYGTIIGGIVSNTLRPLVPESSDPEWRSLMERCWSSEPSERPSFTEVANLLRAMAAKIPPKGHSPQQLQQPPTTQPPV
ncbi:Mitogen-activated protein kinase kinase kinase [Parasponia andersonii]|uniref:Mitogen-activated protein kinase kinase kinase n=1 Tax=Parasponia andersonii TaxID=3476 RepID=A0A2P5D1I0_PARAD|nr:Mitogen-activated protein kinase kinase kinase [Parasponia andersonii]